MAYFAPSLPTANAAYFAAADSTVAPQYPSNFVAAPISGTEINLSWSAGAGATSYEVEIETPSGQGNWSAVAPAVAGLAIAVAGRQPATSHRFRLRGVNGSGTSAWVISGTAWTDNTGAGSVEIPNAPPLAPVIVAHPAAQSVVQGSVVLFNSQATGYPAPTGQWQIKTANGSWVNISGATAFSYSTTSALSDTGKQFRIVYTNGAGVAISSEARLTVTRTLIALENALNRILPYATGCPPQVASFHLLQAAKDFFQRTLAWLENLEAIEAVAGTSGYFLPVPNAWSIAKLVKYQVNGADKAVSDAEDAQSITGNWQSAWTFDRQTAMVSPVPRQDGDQLVFSVALKPSDSTLEIPLFLYEQYISHIADGALATLLGLPKTEWEDQRMASEKRGSYELAIARVGLMTSKGFTGGGQSRRKRRVF